MNKTIKILLMFILTITLFTIGTEKAEAVCITPGNSTSNITNLTANSYNEICSGTYNVTLGTEGGRAVFYFTGSNITVVCNATVLVGNGSGYAFAYSGGVIRNHNSITGCTANNFQYNYYFLRQNNLTLINNTGLNSYMENMFLSRVTNSTVYNNFLNNSYGSLGFSHSLYISAGTTENDTHSISVYNNTFSNAVGNGIHINSVTVGWVNNLSIYNNYIYNTSFSINDFASSNSNFYNNTFYKTLNYGLRLSHDATTVAFSPKNNNYFNNIFTGGDTFGHITIRDNVNDNRIYNNTYTENYALINIRANMTSANISEGNLNYLRLEYSTNTTNVTFNYTGRYNLYFEDLQLNLTNQNSQYPFNDVLNVSSNMVLSSNVDDYSITLSSGAQISVGDYGALIYDLTSDSTTIQACINSRNGVVSAMSELPFWFGLIFVVLAAAIIMGIVIAVNNDVGRGSSFGGNVSFESLGGAVVPILLAGFLVAIGIIVMYSFC